MNLEKRLEILGKMELLIAEFEADVGYDEDTNMTDDLYRLQQVWGSLCQSVDEAIEEEEEEEEWARKQ